MSVDGSNHTTAWERKLRRREVIRLRAQGFSQSEIAEDLGVSRDTVRRDIKRINEELGKLDDPDHLQRLLRQGARKLYEEEFEDLERADREGDERAKHRAKTSMRRTLEFLEDLESETTTAETSQESWLEELDEDLRAEISEAAGAEVEEILE